MTRGQIQMSGLAIIASVLTLGGLGYITSAPPAYLKATRYGVPYYTPAVINPVTGQPVDVNTLVRHYLGE
ncbi:hypothetical protein BI364_06480 [Acidihalobacter yilgarnensis]|uniref:Uncharacterized protein n=1 Tax=Acidihalobacter yilgarnensis TaxID=2819280 RepID=A0A1D8IMG0_9GAMM|nr:hypothetical protein [Acidihalobacter yilgarnensis]AOU97650.1 hypothetical protein BI364_06480 [Acidihalobacter yilgarnensis]